MELIRKCRKYWFTPPPSQYCWIFHHEAVWLVDGMCLSKRDWMICWWNDPGSWWWNGLEQETLDDLLMERSPFMIMEWDWPYMALSVNYSWDSTSIDGHESCMVFNMCCWAHNLSEEPDWRRGVRGVKRENIKC
jgi:hypothetical protein